MKNKKALYYAVLPIAYFILSLICVSVTFVVLKISLDIYYRYNSQYGGTLIDAINFFMLFKAQSGLDRNLNYVIIAICTFIVYYLFMRKTYVGLAKIVDATNQMAAGDLDKTIDIDCKGDTKILGDNINIISRLLRDARWASLFLNWWENTVCRGCIPDIQRCVQICSAILSAASRRARRVVVPYVPPMMLIYKVFALTA